MVIQKATDFDVLIRIWEVSVRATHDFISEADIVRLKPLIHEHYFPALTLWQYATEQGVLGFIGIDQHRVEMLFVAPESRGMSVGQTLINFALKEEGVTEVDVNEQNGQAVGFYQHMGFEVVRRSPLDGEGKPYPLLHMRMNSSR